MVLEKFLMSLMLLIEGGFGKTEEGYCVAEKTWQQTVGLLKYDRKEDFVKECKGVLVFKMDGDCSVFHSYGVKFRFYLSTPEKVNVLFPESSEMKVCGKIVVEHTEKLEKKKLDEIVRKISQ